MWLGTSSGSRGRKRYAVLAWLGLLLLLLPLLPLLLLLQLSQNLAAQNAPEDSCSPAILLLLLLLLLLLCTLPSARMLSAFPERPRRGRCAAFAACFTAWHVS